MNQTSECRSPQIAGKTCQICNAIIVVSTEGKFCTHCEGVVHLACEPAARCGACGHLFAHYDPPAREPLREAVLPRSLQPSRSSGPIVATFAALVTAILVFVFFILKAIFGPGGY